MVAMMNNPNRRVFMKSAGVLAGLGACNPSSLPSVSQGDQAMSIKPILGSWFEFQHHNEAEGIYWNPACTAFTAEDWKLKVHEIAELGFQYLVLLAIALDFKTYYDSAIFPKHTLGCDDPLEAVLSAADDKGIRFFISNGFFGDWRSHDIITDPEAAQRRLKAMGEIAERYGSHTSFYGWYWPNEACIDPYYSETFIRYVNESSAEAHRLTPNKKTLIAPYGTNKVSADDTYVKQLEEMDIDIIAYQDEIGVQKTKVGESAAYYERLRKVHDRVPQVALWADVEVFEFEGTVYQSALLPASFERVERQLEAVSPYVETVLIYQYQGMMNKPGSPVFAGHPDSAKLYSDYRQWLEMHHPDTIEPSSVE